VEPVHAIDRFDRRSCPDELTRLLGLQREPTEVADRGSPGPSTTESSKTGCLRGFADEPVAEIVQGGASSRPFSQRSERTAVSGLR
jgi:hypothetical protein